MVQWLRLHAPNAGGPGLIPGQGTRSHMPQLRVCIPQLRVHVSQLRPSSAKQIKNNKETKAKPKKTPHKCLKR